MRIITVLLFLFFTLATTLATTRAEAQCLLCAAVGVAIGSSSGSAQAFTSSGNAVYVAPRIGERIADPLDVRIAVSPRLEFSERSEYNATQAQTMTLRGIFGLTIRNPGDFTILEIVRVIDPRDNNIAVFWFAFIENQKMRPLAELSSN